MQFDSASSRIDVLSIALNFLFFFLLIRPPRRSTLFPYTTLFRSLRRRDFGEHRTYGLIPGIEPGRFRHFAARQDRKSTRLNSSHVRISYAVFCLKKKIAARNEIYLRVKFPYVGYLRSIYELRTSY